MTGRKGIIAAVLAALAFMLPVGILTAVMLTATIAGSGHGDSNANPMCSAGGAVPVSDSRLPALDADQSKNAQIIIAVGAARKIPHKGLVVAIATAYQESKLHNLDYGDRDSLGLFQQRPSAGWGTPAQIRDPQYAAGKFYDALQRVPGWESMAVTEAAQAVQRSGFPTAYAQWETLAEKVVGGAEASGSIQAVADTCVGDQSAYSGDGSVVYPLPAGSGYYDNHNYGDGGSLWSHGHTGTDLSVACGTPVRAATGGKIIVRTDQAWAGPWLVYVSTGPGHLTTWYAHMQHITVHDGQAVKAGQQIGEVGQLGNATGCHLHFEVHPHGGSIYEDGIDPSPWLAANVGRHIALAGKDTSR